MTSESVSKAETMTGQSAQNRALVGALFALLALINRWRKLIFCCAGIFIFYFLYGIMQEKITRVPYVDENGTEKFNYYFTLLLVQCFINAAFATILLILDGTVQRSGLLSSTASRTYFLCSISYIGAMLASNTSLKWVRYPTQVLGKSVKPIPVMVGGVLIAGKRYPLLKYLFVLMIVTGVAMFMYKDSASTDVSSEPGLLSYIPEISAGKLLLLLSLTLDGVTGALQDKLRIHENTQSVESSSNVTGKKMMLFLNLWSIVWLSIAGIFSGELLRFFTTFLPRFPYVLPNMFLFGLSSALGQTFIFLTIANFGPLTCSIATTTRKFFTILASVLIFGNPMSIRQLFATLLVFAGLFLDIWYSHRRSHERRN